MAIEWDPVKSAANVRKHDLSFEEAAELLESDADYLEIYDEQHSQDDDGVRIVGARMATKAERGRYGGFEEARRG